MEYKNNISESDIQEIGEELKEDIRVLYINKHRKIHIKSCSDCPFYNRADPCYGYDGCNLSADYFDSKRPIPKNCPLDKVDENS